MPSLPGDILLAVPDDDVSAGARKLELARSGRIGDTGGCLTTWPLSLSVGGDEDCLSWGPDKEGGNLTDLEVEVNLEELASKPANLYRVIVSKTGPRMTEA